MSGAPKGRAMDSSSLRVALQSRQLLRREALAACLDDRDGFTVVGHTAALADLSVICELRRPQVVLVDLTDPVDGQAAALLSLRQDHPDVGVVGIYDEPAALSWASRTGVAAALPSSHGLDALLAMLRKHAGRAHHHADSRLTDGELAVLWLMNAGHSAAEMAGALGISQWTVENRKRRVYAKLEAHSQSHAISRAAALGFGQRWSPKARSRTGRALVAMVRGPAGKGTDRVAEALMSRGVPFILDRRRTVTSDDHLPWIQDAPVVAVLIRPNPADWLVCEGLGVPILLVSADPPDPGSLADAVSQGAWAVVTEDDVGEQLLPVLAVLACGFVAVRAALAGPLADRLSGRAALPALTARESDILRSVERGESVRQTARALGISTKTVENLQARMFRKLGVRNRAAALALAHRIGLLTDGLPSDGNPLGPLRGR
jgi:two-component system nitrate/nitrite response regulator NarL